MSEMFCPFLLFVSPFWILKLFIFDSNVFSCCFFIGIWWFLFM